MIFKVSIESGFQDKNSITTEVNGIVVYPFGLDNKNFIRIHTLNEDSAIAIAAGLYRVDKKMLTSTRIFKHEPEAGKRRTINHEPRKNY